MGYLTYMLIGSSLSSSSPAHQQLTREDLFATLLTLITVAIFFVAVWIYEWFEIRKRRKYRR